MGERTSTRHSPSRRRKKAGSGAGLWIGLGIGVLALVGVVVLIVVLAGGSSEAKKKLVGQWQKEGDTSEQPKRVEFTQEGHFRMRMPDGQFMPFGTFDAEEKGATITVSKTSKIVLNGQQIRTLTVEFVGDNQMELKFLDIVEKFRKVN